MTLQDCFDYRRWAESMLNEASDNIKKRWSVQKVNEYSYLSEWIFKFDRIVSGFTCWPEHHNVYKHGIERLKQLSKTL